MGTDRQNTEGEYAMLEHENVPGVVESLKITSEKNVERLCRYAFDYARANGRKRVTIVHKVRAILKENTSLDHKVLPLYFLCSGQHHEAHRWLVPGDRAESGQGLPRH